MGASEAAVREIVIPYTPRPQFLGLHERTNRWGVAVCHRRAGKTVSCINELIKRALMCDKQEPRFAYAAPFYAQAKDVAWSYLKRFTAVIPGVESHESELRVDLPNGGRVRLYGLDNYDRLRGGYFDGIVLDEYGDADPRAWQEVIRPALSDRKGWALFIGTPKGRNHFSEIWDQAQRDSDWFTMMLRASESGLLDPAELIDARKTMTEDQYEAEFECSFQAAVIGAYYGREMQAAENAKRIVGVPHDPATLVHTAWDLGIGDSTAIWFAQMVGKEVHLIDYIENSGVGLDWYVARLKEGHRANWNYGEHLLPHDAEAKELGTGKSRVETLAGLGMGGVRVLAQRRKEDTINGARLLIPRCWFDVDKCQRGIDALRNYRREWDDKRKVFHDRPLHDWASHGADAFGELAAGQPGETSDWSKPLKYNAKSVI
jgi:phage terminase large subunit